MPLLDSRARTPSAELVFFFSLASRLFLSRPPAHRHPAPAPPPPGAPASSARPPAPRRGAPEICSHAPPPPSHPPSPAAAATWEFLCSGKFGPNHPYINPASSPEELRQLGSRRVLVTTAELCWFVERARAYAEGIKKCGWEGELEFYETKGEGHVYFLPKPECDNVVKELAVVADFVRRC